MKSHIFLAMMLLTVSCSSRRYSYLFNQPTQATQELRPVVLTETEPARETVEFTANAAPAVNSPPQRAPATVQRPLKIPIQVIETQKKGGTELALQGKEKLDPDLKRSFIFAASGLVALLIGGTVFWVLGSLSLLIGFIFGIKWLLRK